MILALWALPRSRSTAFFAMMAGRGDFGVLHEPFSNRAEFGHTRIGGRAVRSEAGLLDAVRRMAAAGPVFFKDTTDERYPGVLADEAFLARDAQHTFLIRHPRQTIASYHALNPGVRRDQIGVQTMHEMFERVRQATGRTPVVIDSDDLVAAPAAVVAGYCARVGIAYRSRALTWRPGDRREWRPTARWHVEVSRSAGFTRTSTEYPVDVDTHPVLSGYLDHHLPFYEDLYDQRVRV